MSSKFPRRYPWWMPCRIPCRDTQRVNDLWRVLFLASASVWYLLLTSVSVMSQPKKRYMIETFSNRTDFEKLICLWLSTPRKILSGFAAGFPKTHRFQQSENAPWTWNVQPKFSWIFQLMEEFHSGGSFAGDFRNAFAENSSDRGSFRWPGPSSRTLWECTFWEKYTVNAYQR